MAQSVLGKRLCFRCTIRAFLQEEGMDDVSIEWEEVVQDDDQYMCEECREHFPDNHFYRTCSTCRGVFKSSTKHSNCAKKQRTDRSIEKKTFKPGDVRSDVQLFDTVKIEDERDQVLFNRVKDKPWQQALDFIVKSSMIDWHAENVELLFNLSSKRTSYRGMIASVKHASGLVRLTPPVGIAVYCVDVPLLETLKVSEFNQESWVPKYEAVQRRHCALLFGRKGTGIAAHVDNHGVSTYLLVLRGKKTVFFARRGKSADSEGCSMLMPPKDPFRPGSCNISTSDFSCITLSPGQAILIGSGVPHATVNNEDSMAYTFSFLNSSNLVQALSTHGSDTMYFRSVLKAVIHSFEEHADGQALPPNFSEFLHAMGQVISDKNLHHVVTQAMKKAISALGIKWCERLSKK